MSPRSLRHAAWLLGAERKFLEPREGGRGFWPFQTLSVGPVGAGHRFRMRAKNTAIPGLAGMMFSSREEEGVDEIDLEIVAIATERPARPGGSATDRAWTDLRMATWIDANKNAPEPTTLVQQAARDADGGRRRLRDNAFHVYTIEWDASEVRFLIDGVHQQAIADAVPDRPARLIFGLRQMPWAGRSDWERPQTMTVDWISIEPLNPLKIPRQD